MSSSGITVSDIEILSVSGTPPTTTLRVDSCGSTARPRTRTIHGLGAAATKIGALAVGRSAAWADIGAQPSSAAANAAMAVYFMAKPPAWKCKVGRATRLGVMRLAGARGIALNQPARA